MAVLAAVIAGRYTMTWNSLAAGLLSDAGIRLGLSIKEQLINKSDGYAQTLIESVYAGCDWNITLECLEYGAAMISTAINPHVATLGQLGTIATLGTAAAKALVLTSTAGTPAAAAPATLTATLAKQGQNSNTELSFTSQMRTVPLRFDLYPEILSGAVKHFVLG